jgi:chloramphenicol 3-O-phosphotransferase
VTGRLIGITGPAAAGKSTLLRALQAALSKDGELWFAVQLDDFARGIPPRWVTMAGRSGRYGNLGFTYTAGDDGAIALTLGADGRRVLAAFHRAVAAIAASGVDVIFEAIVHDDADWADWQAALGDRQVLWVRLAAPVAILEYRERFDPTRQLQGLARGMSARPPVGRADIAADTSAESTEAIMARVMAALRAVR